MAWVPICAPGRTGNSPAPAPLRLIPPKMKRKSTKNCNGRPREEGTAARTLCPRELETHVGDT